MLVTAYVAVDNGDCITFEESVGPDILILILRFLSIRSAARGTITQNVENVVTPCVIMKTQIMSLKRYQLGTMVLSNWYYFKKNMNIFG